MTSKTVAALLTDLGVVRSHSRPRVSNDNPFSEASFRTLKYAPVFPDRFGSLQHARSFLDEFVQFYNHEPPASCSRATGADRLRRGPTIVRRWRGSANTGAGRPDQRVPSCRLTRGIGRQG